MDLGYKMELIWIPKLKYNSSEIIVNDDTFVNLNVHLDKIKNKSVGILGITGEPKVRVKLCEYITKLGYKHKIYKNHTKILICKYHTYHGDLIYSYDNDAVCRYSDETCNYDFIEVRAYRFFIAIFCDEIYDFVPLDEFSNIIKKENTLEIHEEYAYKKN
ncbi:MAG: hypothetical protein Edafosvirus17_19 [Edafosvirus sp.]|uniref:Uncharacterized protein n=1 Tax=Edafosvirus sp. TaxID=2487765 RepID=A0A3G4ZY95_9VIRU|nr:MAG: hypothetical protein Edafosvirus17_19 [Edafosvirus sp.]